MPNWTWNKVDTDAFIVSGGGLQPNFVCRKTGQTCRPEGESNYLGTELNVALTYRFAPGLVFDWAAGLHDGRQRAVPPLCGQRRTTAGGRCLPVRKDIGVHGHRDLDGSRPLQLLDARA